MPDNSPLLASKIPSSTRIEDLAVVTMNGDPLVVCVDVSYRVWTWDPLRDVWRQRPLPFGYDQDIIDDYPDAENQIDQVAVTVAGGRVVLAAGHDEQPVSFWDLETGELLRRATLGEDDYLGAVATVRGPGPARFVSSGHNSDVLLLWEEPFDSWTLLAEDVHVWSLATAEINGRSLVAGADGSSVLAWDLARPDRKQVFNTTESTWAVSWSRVENRPVVVAAADPGQLWVWELPDTAEDREHEDDAIKPRYEPINGHDGRIEAVDTAMVGGRPLAVTGSEDATVRVWDLAEGVAVGGPLVDHEGRVLAVKTAVLRGRDVALSAGQDGVIRVWGLPT
ncbi:WD40 repeat domain-containing protein [Embleya sp. NPDC050154]|uniref:WD40 repeat domain-containing protein n=1 Tax=Embleya sp. NPDC050154 TaxID=3363988 RepID=UPI0037B413DD